PVDCSRRIDLYPDQLQLNLLFLSSHSSLVKEPASPALRRPKKNSGRGRPEARNSLLLQVSTDVNKNFSFFGKKIRRIFHQNFLYC
ncbi:MAG: hypothetical protein LBQ51_06280, partial [Desulfovibrio sp.]|nr:hypothetical protein [Desulfovibrio sp.]